MSKDEYLKLAKSKGWDKHIPQLKDGTYYCDIFGGDEVWLRPISPLWKEPDLRIFGNLFLGKDACIGFVNLIIGGNAMFGANAKISGLYAGGDIVLGPNANVFKISAGDYQDIFSKSLVTYNKSDGNIVLSRNSDVDYLYAKGIIIIDEDCRLPHIVSAQDEIIYADEPA